MHLLNITPMLPYPGATGTEPLVSYGQLTTLAARHRVTLATFADPDPAEHAALGGLQDLGIDVRAICRQSPTPIARWWQRWAWLRGRDPFWAVWFWDPAMQRLIAELQAVNRFDLVQVEDTVMGHYHYDRRIPMVLTEHEVRVAPPDVSADQAAANPVRRALTRIDRRRWRAYHPRVWSRFDRVQVFTPRDAAALRRLAPALSDRVRVNPFGVDVPAAIDPLVEQPGTLVFIGGVLASVERRCRALAGAGDHAPPATAAARRHIDPCRRRSTRSSAGTRGHRHHGHRPRAGDRAVPGAGGGCARPAANRRWDCLRLTRTLDDGCNQGSARCPVPIPRTRRSSGPRRCASPARVGNRSPCIRQ